MSSDKEEELKKEFFKYRIKSDLEFVTTQLRVNQASEYYVDDNTIYRLNAKGDLKKIETPLTNEEVISGNWQDTSVDTKFRIGHTKDGKLELKAFGIRSNLPLSNNFNPNQEIDLYVISKNITESTNKFIEQHKATSVKQIGDNIEIDADTFADGDNFNIDGKSSIFKIFSEGTGIVTTLLKTSEIEKKVYLSSSKSDVVIHAPGLVTGAVEVAAQKVTDVTGLVTLVYEISTEDKVRKELKDQFKGIKDQIGEDPKAFFPILKEVTLTVLTNNTAEEWAKTIDSNADLGERSHLTTRGTANAVISIMSVATLYTKLPHIAENFTNGIKKVKKISIDLDDFIVKTKSEKLDIIKEIWELKYPDMFTRGSVLEKIMGHYHYKKTDKWLHTGDISSNFTAVDFYKGYRGGNEIFADIAVSMKTTIVEDVNKWLKMGTIKDNINFLVLSMDKGIKTNSIIFKSKKAKIDIYMKKENITPALKNVWEEKLKKITKETNIEFEIKSIEDNIINKSI